MEAASGGAKGTAADEYDEGLQGTPESESAAVAPAVAGRYY